MFLSVCVRVCVCVCVCVSAWLVLLRRATSMFLSVCMCVSYFVCIIFVRGRCMYMSCEYHGGRCMHVEIVLLV